MFLCLNITQYISTLLDKNYFPAPLYIKLFDAANGL